MADADSTRCCLHCGAAIVPRINKTTGQPSKVVRRFCSNRCMWAAGDARRGPRKRSGEKLKVWATCFVCAKPFQSYQSTGAPDGWTRCCSDTCGRRSRSMRAQAFLAQNITLVSRHRYKCLSCGKRFNPQQAHAKYCSTQCYPSAHKWEPIVKKCVSCNGEFKQERKWQRVCSDACADEIIRKGRRVTKSQRRARIRNAGVRESIDPFDVFDRDKWTCQLCGKRTPKRLRGTIEADAPELDHIIPLALGGGHVWHNVQCACRACNGSKGAKAMGQLGLPLAG